MGRGAGAPGRRRAVLTALLAVSALVGAAGRAAGTMQLAPCTRDPADPSRCGRVTVPLDRGGALPGTIALRVRVLEPSAPPAGGAPSPAPVIGLAGGPGQAAAGM